MTELELSPGQGLTEEQARVRLARDGANELPRGDQRRGLRLALEILRQPMILLLLASGAVYLLLGDPSEALFLLGSIGLLIAIEFHQERKAERALEALRDLSSPRARVIRGGETKRIPGREVVQDDLVVVSEGDRVPADGLVVSGPHLSVDESLLTGESVPVHKVPWTEEPVSGPPGGAATPYAFSGTLVVRGKAEVRVTATGSRTQIGRIGKAIEAEPPQKSRLQDDVARLVRYSAVAGVVSCILVVLTYGLTRGSWLEAFLAGLSLAISLLPEEFPVILTIFLALGAWRIARSRVLTRRPSAIEALGTATVLCVDKTGTLTENRMTIRLLQAGGEGEGTLLEYAALASQRNPVDPMDRAVRERRGPLHPDWVLIREYPLSSGLLAMTRAWLPPGGTEYVVATKGAPEAVADLCRLGPSEAQRVARDVVAAADRGLRVLGVARSRFVGAGLPSSPRDFKFEFLGLVGFEDPIRPTVPAALRECAAAGIRTVMITGDYPGTARHVARTLGLPGADEWLTGGEMAALGEEELRERVKRTNVFARMVPEQKLRLVHALKAQGEIVAMTGDGVNDAPALKAAHIGIAMGSRGTDVARESAALVLLDDDFASIVHAVRLGRRIFDNLRKAVAFVIAVHVPIAGAAFFPVLFGWPLLLYPAHLVFMELIVDPICSIAFEGEKEEADVMRRRPRRSGEGLFTWTTWIASLLQGAGVLATVLAAFFVGREQGLEETGARALAFGTLVVGALSLVLVNRSRSKDWASLVRGFNMTLVIFLGAAVLLLILVLYVPWIASIFRVKPPDGFGFVFIGAAGLASVLWSATMGRVNFRKRVE